MLVFLESQICPDQSVKAHLIMGRKWIQGAEAPLSSSLS